MHTDALFIYTVVMIMTVAFSGLLLYKLPGLTRPDLYFSVTIKPGFRQSEGAREILARYQREIIIHTLVGIGVILVAARFRLAGALVVGVLWQVGGFFVAFLRAREQVKPYATESGTSREVNLVAARTELPGGRLAQAVPFAILVATAIWLNLHWSEIPNRFPVHWGLDGRPDGWASRSAPAVYAPILMGLAICGGLLLLNYAIAAFSRRIRASGREAAAELRFKRIMLSIMLGVEFFMALLFSWVGLLALRASKEGPNPALILLGALAVVGIVTLVVIRTGQGGTKLAASDQSAFDSGGETSPIGDRTPDRYWKAGMFYVNPDDPAVMVESRFGVGYTLNFGRPLAWIILVLLAGVPLAAALVLRFMK